MIRIREIDHLVLRVTDLDAMLRFYCQVLGCSVERRQEAIGLVQLRAGRSAELGTVLSENAHIRREAGIAESGTVRRARRHGRRRHVSALLEDDHGLIDGHTNAVPEHQGPTRVDQELVENELVVIQNEWSIRPIDDRAHRGPQVAAQVQ